MNKKQIMIRFIIGAVVLAGTFLLGVRLGSQTAMAKITKQQADTREQSQPEAKAEISKEKEEEPKVYKLGEAGTVGNWNIKVLEAKETNSVKGGTEATSTKEKFIVIKLQLKNISKQPCQYASNEFVLGSRDSSQYTINDVAFDAMGNANSQETIYNENTSFIGAYDDVNPNTVKQTYIAFEVPKNIKVQDCILMNSNNNVGPVGFFLK